MRLILPFAIAAMLFAGPANADPCVDEIKAAMDAALAAGPVRIEATIKTPPGPMRMTSEIVPDHAMHVLLDAAGQVMEVTVIEDKAWMRAGGTWTELSPEAAAEMIAAFEATPKPEDLLGMRDALCLGLSDLDGRDLLSYAYTVDEAGGVATTLFFVDPVTNAPVRMQSDLNVNGDKSSMVVGYTYDAAITIAAPIP
jgi:hypothetical protein